MGHAITYHSSTYSIVIFLTLIMRIFVHGNAVHVSGRIPAICVLQVKHPTL